MIRQEFESTTQSIPEDDPILQGKDDATRKRMARFVAVTEKPNRAGNVVETEGWDTANWEKNPVILWGHDYNAPPIGRGVQIKKMGRPRQLLLDVEFTPEEVNPFGAMIGRLVEQGFLRAVSVGFLPKESEPIDKEDQWGPRRFKKQELLEVSVVTVPMDAHALLTMNSADRALLQSKQALPLVTSVLFTMDTTKEQADEWLKAHDYDVINYDLTEVESPTGVMCLSVTVNDRQVSNPRVVSIPGDKRAVLMCGDPVTTPAVNYCQTVTSANSVPSTVYTYVQQLGTDDTTQKLTELYEKTLVAFENVTQAIGKIEGAIRGLSKLAEVFEEEKQSLPPPGKKPVGDPAEGFAASFKDEATAILQLFKKE